MIKKILGLSLFVCSVVAHAAPVSIQDLFVQSASATLNLNGNLPPPSVTASMTFSPAIDITMGSYQSSIFSIGNTSSLYLNVYSTSAYGMPAPTGTVDGSSLTLDLSSLRAQVIYQNSSLGDVALWPLTTTLDSGTYNPLTGNYTATWHETFNLSLLNNNSLSVSLSGYLTTIPAPAAVWLFGSGLLALFGFAKSRKL